MVFILQLLKISQQLILKTNHLMTLEFYYQQKLLAALKIAV
jgi:hypothetical protein